MELKKIYIITSGEYSDYGIDCVFSTHELAKKYIDSLGEGDKYNVRIEEYYLDFAIRHDGRIPHWVRIKKDGYAWSGKIGNPDNDFEKKMDTIYFNLCDKEIVMNINILAYDEKHAIKIANEKRTQYIALNKWPD